MMTPGVFIEETKYISIFRSHLFRLCENVYVPVNTVRKQMAQGRAQIFASSSHMNGIRKVGGHP